MEWRKWGREGEGREREGVEVEWREWGREGEGVDRGREGRGGKGGVEWVGEGWR